MALADGEVLVAGGSTLGAERYDPLTHSWSRAGNMDNPREDGTAARLTDGTVRVTGGPTTQRYALMHAPTIAVSVLPSCS